MASTHTQPRRFQPRVLVGRGSREVESFLLDEVDRRLEEAVSEPALLARPLRVVVPSRSLRLHLGSALVRHRGRAAAGLVIQTHFHLALETIERAGEPRRSGRWLSELLIERRARELPALARPLDGLIDGLSSVVATVHDLLDAGFEPALLDGVDEALASDGPRAGTRSQVARARALMQVAARTWEGIEETELGSTARLLTRATEVLEAHGEALLPARAMWLHGYADATGVVTDLIQTLQRRFGAWVLVDRPPDPALADAAPRRAPASAGPTELSVDRFGERFVERLSRVASPESIPESGLPPREQQIERVAAQGTEGEVREVARRIEALLETASHRADTASEDALRPEEIGVVARDLGPYRRAIRRRFGLLGLPFSALGEGGAPTAEERRARALLDLLRRAGDTPAQRWLETLERLPAAAAGEGEVRWFRGPVLMDLRLAFAALGAGRLAEVARLDVASVLGDRDFLPLPARHGIRLEDTGGVDPDDPEAENDQSGEESGDRQEDELEAPTNATRVRLPRRTLGRPVLEAAVAAARRLLETLGRWPASATPAEHKRRLEGLIARQLGVSPTERPRPLLDAAAALDAEAPEGFEVSFDELRRLLARVLEARPGSALGGAGGGVQVLSVTEARARTFRHLFVIGCNRGVFPRPIREDPMLPDALRRLLHRVLPDVPVKSGGFDEERHLFAQLLSSSPKVTLSWQQIDDQGALRPASPLVERLGLGEPERPAPTWSAPQSPLTATPPIEAATLVALHGPRGAFRKVFPSAVARALPPPVAAARLAVLDEIDPDRSTPEGRATWARLGPFFGWVGPVDDASRDGRPDPRRQDLWVTTVERLAGCPWQVFLTRLLGLEPTPDPLAAVPGIDPLLLGKTVHRALEALVDPAAPEVVRTHRARSETLGEILARTPSHPRWPNEPALDGLILAAAREVLLDEGLALPGLTRALARACRPYVEAVAEIDWAQGPPAVLGAEIEGELSPDPGVGHGSGRPLRFRADRVDLVPGGGLLLTDYKTGRPPGRGANEGKRESTRRRYLLDDVASGARLQAVAYALAGGAGRYLFLRPDTEFRDRGLRRDDRDFDSDFAPAFHRAVRAGRAGWDAGSFFPRLVDPTGEAEPPRCSWCPVAEACLRGDSGARLRLVERSRGAPSETGDPTQTALLDLWWLGAEPPASDTATDHQEAPE